MTNFFKVIIESRTYLNILYLLLSFPLGIFYFVFLVTALSLGLGLAITLFGIPILLATLLLWRIFAKFENNLIKILLKINIPFKPLKLPKSIWKKIQAYLTDSFTWRSLAYLFIKYPLGIFSFVVLVTLISISLSFIATPIVYYLTKIGIIHGTFCISNICFMNYPLAFLTSIIGVFLVFISLHAFNGLAKLSGILGKYFLKK